jgi:hypothetical protein
MYLHEYYIFLPEKIQGFSQILENQIDLGYFDKPGGFLEQTEDRPG